MKNDKDDCFDSIVKNLTRTSVWRRSLQAKYPDQPNGEAAEITLKLAKEAALTDEQWAALRPFYSWSSPDWHAALSDAARHVGFYITTMEDFVQHLANLLARQTRAIA